ncbi:hypothetical protein [Dyadobacter crusticola]|uniref:hypothetical protein n=1 Tax=Dyadobacter crusticola TaxID=292407 RepID=UPI0004E174F9|nr:hypothetical protein [Dyadobacter crusticola]
MRTFSLFIVLVLTLHHAYAQDDRQTGIKEKMMDSIKAAYLDNAALMYPRLRQFSITHQENLTTNLKAKLYGKDFFKSKFRSSRTTINMNFPVYSDAKNIVAGNLGVVHQFFGMSDVTNYMSDQTVVDMHTYIPMLSLGASYIRRDTLFNRPVSFSGSINALVNPSFSSRQFTFRGLVNFPIRRTENSNLMAGALVMIDPSAPAPFFLFFSYYHSFRSIGLELMADMPYRFALRKSVARKASVTAFAEMDGSNSFFEFEKTHPTLPCKMTYSTLEIKSGLLFEYQLTKKMVFSLSTGINSTLKSRILEQGAKPKDYFISNKNSAAPFVQFGVSMLPFWTPFKGFHK